MSEKAPSCGRVRDSNETRFRMCFGAMLFRCAVRTVTEALNPFRSRQIDRRYRVFRSFPEPHFLHGERGVVGRNAKIGLRAFVRPANERSVV
jgi:hypothetical protein